MYQNRFPDHSLCYIDDIFFVVIAVIVAADLSALDNHIARQSQRLGVPSYLFFG
jgi:hypothetical protein